MKTLTSTLSRWAATATLISSILIWGIIATANLSAVRCDETFSRQQRIIRDNSSCVGPDLVITSVKKHAEAVGQTYTVFIKNVGDTPAIIGYPKKVAGWQAYLSKDGVSKDIRVPGKNLSGKLGVGETITSYAFFSEDLNSFPNYLIVELFVLSGVGECNSDNNTFVLLSSEL